MLDYVIFLDILYAQRISSADFYVSAAFRLSNIILGYIMGI